MRKSDFRLGMTVYIAGGRRFGKTGLTKATISKIGRKWVEVEPKHLGRFSIETGMEDGGAYSPERKLYLSRDQYFDAVNRGRLISALLRINKHELENVPTPQLEQAAELLNLEHEKVDRTAVEGD